jgi:hypothetical protein
VDVRPVRDLGRAELVIATVAREEGDFGLAEVPDRERGARISEGRFHLLFADAVQIECLVDPATA